MEEVVDDSPDSAVLQIIKDLYGEANCDLNGLQLTNLSAVLQNKESFCSTVISNSTKYGFSARQLDSPNQKGGIS